MHGDYSIQHEFGVYSRESARKGSLFQWIDCNNRQSRSITFGDPKAENRPESFTHPPGPALLLRLEDLVSDHVDAW